MDRAAKLVALGILLEREARGRLAMHNRAQDLLNAVAGVAGWTIDDPDAMWREVFGDAFGDIDQAMLDMVLMGIDVNVFEFHKAIDEVTAP